MSPEGLWLYSVADDKVQLVAKGVFGDFIWSADAKTLYGILHNDGNVYEAELWQYNMDDILSPPATSVP
jgi:hypothetical protein